MVKPPDAILEGERITVPYAFRRNGIAAA